MTILSDDIAPPAGGPRAHEGAPGEAPVNILIVDDEQKNLLVLETVLDDPGYRLVRADNVDKALMALIAEEFALIILDINMPGMSGFELAQMIRGRRRTANVPIIFLTAYYNEDEHVLEGYAAGAVDYLHKPVNRTILRSKVATFVELHRSHRALQQEVAERRLMQEQLRAMNETLEQRVAEKTQALRESDAQFRAMIDALPVAIYTTDANGYLTRFNPATAALARRRPEIGVDRWSPMWKLYEADGTPLPHERSPMAEAINEGRTVRGRQIIAERPDGDRIWVMPYPTPFRDADGVIVGGINMLVDITDAKRAEAELGAAKRAAEVANAAKTDFLAHMSHEIRTPMNAIFGFTQLLSESIQAPGERDWIASIKKSGELLLSVINDVLDLSKIEAGKLDLHPQPTDIAHIIDDMIVMFAPQADAKGITLTGEVDGDSLPLLIDGHRMRQILMNLISNAVKFTERGGVTVRLEIDQGASDAVRDVELTVLDTGTGLPVDQIGRIFEPFCQAESPDGKSRPGTGLGLTIARRLVDAMSGQIEVESRPGEGTLFTVRIPGLTASDRASVRASAGEDVDFDRLPPLTILVVDDVAWNLEVAAGYLRNSRHAVHLAAGGQEGLAAARALRPDVVLLDLRMPGMDGYQVRDAIRADPALAQVAVIAVTASSLARDGMDLQQGFEGFVRKPYSPTELFGALFRHFAPGAPDSTHESTRPGVWNAGLRAQWQDLQQVRLPALSERMRMREIADFAADLEAFAAEARFTGLAVEAAALRGAAGDFDAKRLQDILGGLAAFPADFKSTAD
ncbi:MAG: response regulator [Lysobacteraceae bacterium]